MGNIQTRNRVDIDKIHEVKGGPAEMLASRSIHNPANYIHGLLPQEYKVWTEAIPRLNKRQMAEAIIMIGQAQLRNARAIENDPVMQEATIIARSSTTHQGQAVELRRRATKLGLRSIDISGNIKRLCKIFAKGVYTFFNSIYNTSKYVGTTATISTMYGWQAGVRWHFCMQAPKILNLELRGAIFTVLCLSSGPLWLVYNKDAIRIFKGLLKGYYDDDPSKSIAASALWMNTAKMIGTKLYPSMTGFRQLNSTLWEGANITISSLDAGLTFMENIPSSRDGVINATWAMTSYIRKIGTRITEFIAEEIANKVRQTMEAARRAAEAARRAATYVKDYAIEKAKEGTGWVINKLKQGLKIATNRLRSTEDKLLELGDVNPVPSSVANDIIDLDITQQPILYSPELGYQEGDGGSINNLPR